MEQGAVAHNLSDRLSSPRSEWHCLYDHQRMSPGRHPTPLTDHTWMENVAQRAVIKDHDLAEIRLDLGEIFDVGPVAEGAVLPIVSPHEVLALYFKPVDDRIGVFLY
jgi:hypothetical protein